MEYGRILIYCLCFNKVNEIIFIQHDPHAGACNIDIKALGIRYSENMPIIKHVAYSDIPNKLLIEFFKNWIENMNVNEDTVLSDARCDG